MSTQFTFFVIVCAFRSLKKKTCCFCVVFKDCVNQLRYLKFGRETCVCETVLRGQGPKVGKAEYQVICIPNMNRQNDLKQCIPNHPVRVGGEQKTWMKRLTVKKPENHRLPNFCSIFIIILFSFEVHRFHGMYCRRFAKGNNTG